MQDKDTRLGVVGLCRPLRNRIRSPGLDMGVQTTVRQTLERAIGTMSIPFTQFLKPDGRKRSVEIDRPAKIEDMATKLYLAGYRFEIEVLQTDEINMETLDSQGELVCGEICANGPPVEQAVDRMITNAYGKAFGVTAVNSQ